MRRVKSCRLRAWPRSLSETHGCSCFRLTCWSRPHAPDRKPSPYSSIAAQDFSALRHLIWSGAAATPKKFRQARALFGNVVESAYGQAEAASVATVLRAHDIVDDSVLASVGKPTLLAPVEIMAPDGCILPIVESGEIVIRSGFNVYPLDVEDVLRRNEAVQESLVFGLPDNKWGERVKAAITLRPDLQADPGALIAFVRQQLGPVKTPKVIHILDDLPRSVVGKVQRREVRKQFLRT